MANFVSAFEFLSDRSIPLKFLPSSSIDISETVCQTIVDPTWMDDIIANIKDGKLPSNKL